MYKSNTTRQKLYILCCLSTRPQNGGREGGCLFEGGTYFKFWLTGGVLIWRGRLFEGGANSRIYCTYNQKAQQPVRMRTYEGTASQSRNNNEDQNAPTAVNQGATNSDTQQPTPSPDEDQQYSSLNIPIHISKWLHRETNEWKIHLSYLTPQWIIFNVHIFNDI